ncbi:MAG: TIGR04255 family protein, partial [Candidatus Dormibacteraceae bacterium]
MQTLPELLDLPDVPVVVYENPPLALTLCQVRFPTVLAVADETVAARFQRAIQTGYPIASPAAHLELNIPLEVGRAQVQQGRLWQFADPSDTWKVVLAQDFVTLETR